MPLCGGKNRLILGQLSTEITPEFIEEMEVSDQKTSEALKHTDPKEYTRFTTATETLRRWLAAAKLRSRK